jgi:outer membrane protein assembly factor BamB
VYCLRAADGVLFWRFKALPDRLMCAYGQVESAWPVCGSILVYDDVAYFVAGRNSFLDGGLFLFGLDPQTGRVIHQQRLYGPYGPDGHPIVSEVTALGATGAGGIEGNKGDILLAEEGHLFLRHQAFTPDLELVSPDHPIPPHLITSHGFIEPTPHHRSWWTIDTTLRYDIATGRGPVHGDILVRDGTRFYEVRGYQPSRTAKFDPRLNGYTLYAGDLATIRVEPGQSTRRAVSASTGEKLAEYKLDAAPVWDSIAVAQGRLYIATQDGNLHCFAERR